jgi:hypothetical protein
MIQVPTRKCIKFSKKLPALLHVKVSYFSANRLSRALPSLRVRLWSGSMLEIEPATEVRIVRKIPIGQK